MRILLDLLPGHDEPLGDAERVDPQAFTPVGTPDAIDRAAQRGEGLWLRGLECGGSTSPFTALVLVRAAVATGRPWVVSGLGVRGMAAALAVGAEGVVLDVQTWTTDASPLCEAHRQRLRGAAGRDTAIVWDRDPPLRLLARGTRDAATPPPDWFVRPDAPIPAPQSVGDLARLEGCRTLAEVVDRTRHELEARVRAARAQHPLRSDPLGCGRPIVQGPMANVAEGTGLAGAVARAGALPFFALGALAPERAREVLDAAARDLGDAPWGVGIIGFDVALRREAHLEACAAHRGRPVIVAGGSPALARRLRDRGLRPWLHAPAPRLVSAALDEGAEAVILEGHEAGGHVGELTSAGLWEEGLAVVEARAASAPLVVLAGGVGCPASAGFAAAMAATAHERGARVALQVGTALFFTHEAVETGQITPIYQRRALAATETVLVGSTVNLPLRCAPNAFTDEARALEQRMLDEGLPRDERRARLERHDLGRTRIAARGIERAPDASPDDPPERRYRPVPDARQRAEGAFTMGQGATVTRDLCSVAELVDALTVRAAALLEGAPDALRRPVVAVAGGPDEVRSAPSPVVRGVAEAAPIAIVGLGCALPGALDVASFWLNLVHAVDAVDVVPPERWDAARYVDPEGREVSRSVTHVAGVVRDLAFDPAVFRIPPAALPTLDRSQQLALFAAAQAVRSAGWERGLDRRRAAVVLGNSMGGEHAKSMAVRVRHREVLALVEQDPALAALTREDLEGLRARVEAGLDDRLPPLGPDSMAGLLSNVIAGRVASWLDWMGGNLTVDAACAASLAAITVAVDWLRAGRCDAVLTGGVDTDLSPETFVGFSRTHALSRAGASPFSQTADGFVMGEGAAVLALQRLDDAVAAGRPVWAVIRGVGQASDGRARGITAPRAEGQRLAIERAHAEAGFGPEDLGLVEAHGTGTPVGDATELDVLRSVHRANPGAWLGSVKSNVGHLKGAAGAAGALKATLAVASGVVPPTLHAGPVRDALRAGRLRLPRSPVTLRGAPRRAAVSAFGFGGTDFHLLLEEPPPEAARPAAVDELVATARPLVRARAWSDRGAPVVLCFGASSRSALQDAVRAGRTVTPEQAAAAPHRAVVLAPPGDPADALHRALRRLERGLDGGGGLHVGSGPAEPAVLLAPGQGSQRVGAVASLARIPAGARRLEALGGVDELEATERYDGDHAADDPASLHQLLPRLAAGWAATLREARVPVAATAGHSLGELGALMAAGRLRPDEALALALARGEALAACPEGAMLAVELPHDQARALSHGLSVASVNGARRCALSGPLDAVEAVAETLRLRAVPHRRLAVRRAFHSPAVAPAADAVRRAARDLRLHDGLPCWSAHTLRPFEDLDALADAVTAPVRFHDLLLALGEAGHRLFLEVGPGRALTAMVERALPEARAVALDPDPSDEDGLVAAAAALLAAGHPGLLRLLPATVARIGAPAPPVATARPPVVAPTADPVEAPAADPPAVAPPDDVRAAVIEAICEITGYPPDLIEDGAELEADLGVDSIRKMEILGLLQERLGFRAEESDYALLAHADLGSLVDYARERRAGPGTVTAEAGTWARAFVPTELPPPADPVILGSVTPLVVRAGARLHEALARVAARAREAPGPLALVVPDEAAGAATAAFARCVGREWSRPVQVVVGDPDDPRVPAALAAGGTVALRERALRPAWMPLEPREHPLPHRPVILATGGGRGIVVPCLRALADLRPRALLLGRSDPEGDPELRDNLDGLRRAGVDVLWEICDVRDRSAVEAAAARARATWGRIDVVLHGAGALRDGPAATRTNEHLAAVLGPKLAGAEHLAFATADDAPALFVLLSSVVAHHGNPGQTLYAAANAAMERVEHPTAARTLVLASTAWSGVGMARDPGLQALLRARGVLPVSPEAGARAFRRALLGHAEPGPPATVLLAAEPPDAVPPPWPLGPLVRLDAASVRCRVPLDPTDPALRDHRVADRPLVPAALWLAALKQAARLVSHASGAVSVEDFRVLHPTFVDAPRDDVTVEVGGAIEGARAGRVRAGDTVVAEARLTTCAAPEPAPAPAPLEGARPAHALYRPDALFHGPAWRVLRRLATDGDGRAWADLEPRIDPLASAIDGVHQLLAVWAGLTTGHLGLPVGARRWVLAARPHGPLRVETRARLGAGGLEADVLATDATGRVVLRGEGVALRTAGRWPALEVV